MEPVVHIFIVDHPKTKNGIIMGCKGEVLKNCT